MRPLSGSLPRVFDPAALERARPLALDRAAVTTRAQLCVAIAVVPMVAITMWLAATSDYLVRPIAAGIYWSYLVAASLLIGLYWWTRRPASRFGPLLVAFGALAWLVSWQGASAPVAFDIGVLAEGPAFVLGIYLFLAFPMGRVEPRAARRLMGALGIAVLLTFTAWALLSPEISSHARLTSCVPHCPASAVEIGAAPSLSEAARDAETYALLTFVAAVFVVYLMRLAHASRPQRRALMAVAVTSLLWLPAFFACVRTVSGI